MGLPDHLTCLLWNLYAGQEATVRTRHGTMDWIKIGKGVRQGCILSPCLFNLYASTSCEMLGWMSPKVESRLQEEISVTLDRQMIPLCTLKMAEWKDLCSSSLARTPKSQLAAEQPSTGDCLIPPKKIPHVRGQRRSPNKMVQFITLDCSLPHGLQHPRLPCPSPTPGVCSSSCPLSWWCHPTISSSVIPFSSCLKSFPELGSFLMSPFFKLGGQSIGASASASVLPVHIQDWFPLGWTGWISLLSKGLSRVFSNTTIQKHQFMLDLSSLTRDQAFALYSGSLEPQPLNYQGRSLIIFLKKKKKNFIFLSCI